jgi:hypothetical protein
MPRKAEGPRPLSNAERQSRQRQKKTRQITTWRRALERIQQAKSVQEAHAIATDALGEHG